MVEGIGLLTVMLLGGYCADLRGGGGKPKIFWTSLQSRHPYLGSKFRALKSKGSGALHGFVLLGCVAR